VGQCLELWDKHDVTGLVETALENGESLLKEGLLTSNKRLFSNIRYSALIYRICRAWRMAKYRCTYCQNAIL